MMTLRLFLMGNSLRLLHFFAFTSRPFSSKNFEHSSSSTFISPNVSLISKVSSAKDMILTFKSPIRMPQFLSSNLSISSSIIRLNNNGDSGHPCFTPEFIFIGLVLPVGIEIVVVALLYRSDIVSLTSFGTPFLCRAFVIESCRIVSKLSLNQGTPCSVPSFSSFAF